MALKTQIDVSISALATKDNDIASVEATINLKRRISLLTGVAVSQADQVFSDTRTLAASGTEDLDLAGGLSDPFGAALTFVKVKAIILLPATGNTNDVLLGGAASNGFVGPFADATDKVKGGPGGAIVLVAPKAGWTVTAATGDLLKVANSSSGTPVTYDIVIVGTSA